ncbi:MAG: 50S ribosomal protein L25 [Deltaproteobacteria bacterium]|nr:50S ribosomal protein L25 [Deltaproteobacteria bacterium]
MERVNITAAQRETGKGPARRLRVAGSIPAVLYGHGYAPKALSVNQALLSKTLKGAAGRSVLINLAIEGQDSVLALLKEYQRDPLKQQITHVDLLAVNVNEQIEVEVPLHFEGQAAGVKEGGVLEVSRRTLTLRCLPNALPEFVVVDISALKIGGNIHANEIQLPPGVTFPHTDNFSVVQVVAPQKEEVAAVVAAAPVEVPAMAQKGEAVPGAAAPSAPAKGGSEKSA